MNAFFGRSQRFLDRSLGIVPRGLMLLCAAVIFPGRVGFFRDEGAVADLWIRFALGAFALLLLRACVQGKVRDLLDVAVLSLYFCLFLAWSQPPGSHLYALTTVAVLTGTALVLAWVRAASEEIAEARTAG